MPLDTMTAESDWDHAIWRVVNLLIEQEDEVDRLRAALKVITRTRVSKILTTKLGK